MLPAGHQLRGQQPHVWHVVGQRAVPSLAHPPSHSLVQVLQLIPLRRQEGKTHIFVLWGG